MRWMANVTVVAAIVGVACAGPAGDDANEGTSTALSTPTLTDAQKRVAERLTSIWENGTTVLQYGYCEDIGDGRGYTSGRAGFCSGTGDALEVVSCLEQQGSNVLSKYVPALRALAAAASKTGKDQASTAALDAVGPYCADWTAAARSTAFRGCQDRVVGDDYFAPAIARAKKWGLRSALTIAELYDAEINHGEEGVDAIIAKANADLGIARPPTTKLSAARESAWLGAFLKRRVETLQADATWREAVDRVAVYEAARRAGDLELARPVRTNAKARSLFPGVAGLGDSGYPDCIVSAETVSGDAACTAAAPGP